MLTGTRLPQKVLPIKPNFIAGSCHEFIGFVPHPSRVSYRISHVIYSNEKQECFIIRKPGRIYRSDEGSGCVLH